MCNVCKVQTFKPEAIIGTGDQPQHTDSCPVPAAMEFLDAQEKEDV
jgi:hypothetical protein